MRNLWRHFRQFSPHPGAQAQQGAGFTLLELSVALAVIGLMVGGVLATQSYLRQARITTIINESKLYITALQQFRQRYSGALPGDMANASDYWAAAGNGDGNGYIYRAGPTTSSNAPEIFLAFQHARLAGLITGNYTGAAGSGGATHSIPGVNLPAMPLPQVSLYYMSMGDTGYTATTSRYFGGYYSTYVYLGRQTSSTSLLDGGFLSPVEAYEVDTKFDNGLPGSGSIRTTVPRSGYNCASSNSPAAATYLGTKTPNQCDFIMTPQ